ncbi:MAG TPA: SRPBCC family protein [Candidatus Binatia bacterium]|nr:SRPBCC family protein [Candidatus Binatia bacterium]
MHKSGPEAMIPAPDDVRPSRRQRAGDVNVPPVERCISVFAGSSLLLSGLRRRSLSMLVSGGVFLYRGATGFCPLYRALGVSAGSQAGLQIEETITVNKPPQEVYPLWRDLQNLPRFMSHLESVMPVTQQRSHWVARVPAPLRLEWDAIIVEDEENRTISWRSLPDSSVDHAGSVLFHHLPARNLTEVKVILSYRPPLGPAGAAVAKLFSGLTEHQIREDLRAFKTVAEAGEKPTIAGQPSGASVKVKEKAPMADRPGASVPPQQEVSTAGN